MRTSIGSQGMCLSGDTVGRLRLDQYDAEIKRKLDRFKVGKWYAVSENRSSYARKLMYEGAVKTLKGDVLFLFSNAGGGRESFTFFQLRDCNFVLLDE